MKAYKGFDKDLKCRGFQFEIGGEYEEAEAMLCMCGFHACESPLDVLKYYPPATSRYCEVELDDVSSKRDGDTKRVGRKIKIGAEIGIEGLINAHIEFVRKRAKSTDKTSENYSNAVAEGIYSNAVAEGDYSNATAIGNIRDAVTTGYFCNAVATGDSSNAVTEGAHSNAVATGDSSNAVTEGAHSYAVATGAHSNAFAEGHYSNAAVMGANSIAIASGACGKVKGALGCAIVCVERGRFNGTSCPILAIKSAIVDGNIIKPDTWYTVKNGEWVEDEIRTQ